jgi:hypothetical protein
MTDRLPNSYRTVPAPSKATGRRGLVLAGCWLLLVGLGWLDYATGYEMSFFVFYSVPVGVAAWWVGRWPAIGMAVGATVTWLLADYFSGAKYSAPFFYYWNSTIHFLAFVINAVTIAKIKSDVDQRHLLAAELEVAREALHTVSRLLPACPACGKPRDEAADNGDAALAALTCEQPGIEVALCAGCRADRAKVADAAGSAASARS